MWKNKVVENLVSISAVSLAALGYYYYATPASANSRAKTLETYKVDKKYNSIRVKDVELIRKRLSLKPDEIKDMFSVIIGPRGIGKTVAIQTAAENLKSILSLFIIIH